MADRGEIITTINHIFDGFNVKNFKEAHKMIDSERTVGKIVIQY